LEFRQRQMEPTADDLSHLVWLAVRPQHQNVMPANLWPVKHSKWHPFRL